MKRILIICMLLFLPCSALAGDIVATWVHKDGNTMKVSIRDSDHIRMVQYKKVIRYHTGLF